MPTHTVRWFRAHRVVSCLAFSLWGAAVPAGAATFTVTNTNDSGAGSLRQAITSANLTAGLDAIAFSIGSGFKSIALLSPLPTITEAVILDARTQPGFAGWPLIELNGTSAGAGANGLTINHAGSSSVFGFIINRFSANGIHVTTAAAVIALNWIGTAAAGNAAAGNGNDGIFLLNTTGAAVGGTTAESRNVVSGNTVDGIRIDGTGGGGNGVYGNYIGTNAAGTAAVPNGFNGVVIINASNNTIGGIGATYRNVISGNARNGIGIRGGSGNVIEANVIGTNAAGAAALANGQNGVYVIDASGNAIGGTVTGTFNVISGNTWNGVHVTGTSQNNVVQRNVIGTNLAGTAAVPNAYAGVKIENTSNNRIGTEWGNGGNLISGNSYVGVWITGTGATSNVVTGNRIGTALAGTTRLGNAAGGVYIEFAPGNRVGGTTNVTPGGACTGECNLVSGNGAGNSAADGVYITGAGATGNVVIANMIGTDVNGTAALGNDWAGVIVMNAGNIVGGTASSSRNVISGNVNYGIWLSGTGTPSVVQGNFIGTSTTGTAAIPNGSGMYVSAANATIGGTVGVTPGGACSGACNLVSGNADRGITFLGTDAVTVLGNYVGTNASGTGAVPNVIGLETWASNINFGNGTAAGRNVVSGNSGNGFQLTADSASNVINGNYVGLSSTGGSLGNGGHGIFADAIHDPIVNTIQANTIAHNAGDGISLTFYGTFRLHANLVHSNGGLGIDLEPNGPNANDAGDGDTGPNGLQNFPVITSAMLCGTNLVVSGTLNSLPNRSFTIELFSSPTCSASGYGEGQAYLGSTTVSTNGSGNATFSITPGVTVAAGQVVTATASLDGNQTSEFSACFTVVADRTPPVVTPPAAVTLDQSTCCGTFGGATSATSTTLNTFLIGSSATDNCGATPTRLTPRVGGADVTGTTCFAVGTTAVTFRHQDASGNVGTATSNVTIRMFGDLNVDSVLDPSDMVVLRAYFNFVAAPGTPPFNAPLSIADLTHDAVVDPSDLVVMRAFFNFAVACLAPS